MLGMAGRVATTPLPAVSGRESAPAGAAPWRKAPRHTYGAVDLGTNNCRLLIARPTPEGFTVRDVGSLNGTYVNRDRIDSVELNDGDEVQIGKYRLVFFSSHPDS